MAGVFHISEQEAERDFGALLKRVRAGDEVIVEDAGRVVVVMRPPLTETAIVKGKTAAEILRAYALWEAEHGKLTVDAEFAEDLEAIHALYNEPLDDSKWG